jgi:hypothetical protein
MGKLTKVLKFTVLLVAFCRLSFAITEYVIVNNGNATSNSAILYTLNKKNGELFKTAVLDTGGQGASPEDYYAQIEQAVSSNAGCVFVLNDGSSDIAAFSKTTGYKRVGKYFNSKLIAGGSGGSLALAPNGIFLYANYGGNGYIGIWKVHPDCTLSLSDTFFAGSLGPIAITANGKYIVDSSETSTVALFAISKIDGSLTSLGSVFLNTGVCLRVSYCIARGLGITKDSKFVVIASNSVDIRHQYSVAVALTARITATGLTNLRAWVLKNSDRLAVNNFPLFSSAGYAGSGNLYFGVESGGGYSPGVLTTHFTESPMSFTVTNATVVDPQVGNIAVTGNVMVIAEYPNQIGVFRIKKDGSLKLLSTTTIAEQGEGLFSLSIFPNTR